MPSEQIERVKALIENHKLKMKAVSLAAGLNETFVRDMIVREREPSADNYRKVMDAIARITGRVQLEPSSGIIPADIEPLISHRLPRDVDVLGAAAGSEVGRGSFHFSMDPIDRVKRPPGLFGEKDIYAAYVENDSMWPMYAPGQLIFVSKSRSPAPGDAVVIQFPGEVEGDESGFVKLLQRRTADWIICKQFNPEGPVKYRNSRGLILHRVFTNNELFGIG